MVGQIINLVNLTINGSSWSKLYAQAHGVTDSFAAYRKEMLPEEGKRSILVGLFIFILQRSKECFEGPIISF